MAYATRDDVYNLALSAQAFVVRPRPLESYGLSDFNPTTGMIRLVGNGFSALDIVYLTVTSGGALPGGAAALTPYSVIPGASGDLFQLAALNTSTPLTFSSAGAGWAIAIDSGRRIDMHLQERAEFIDEHLTAETPPILPDPVTGKYPRLLVGLNARMAARAAVTSLQIENAAARVAVDRLFAMAKADGDTDPPAQPGSLLGDWKAGKPINVRPPDQTAILESAPLYGRDRPSLGWSRSTL